jgi:cobalt/nickel transport system permease protein
MLALTALTCTTPFALLLEAMRGLCVPKLLVMQLGFLYRYLFVLIDEAMRIRRARDFRGAARAPVGRRLRAVGGVIGSLFVRTLERCDRIHAAMRARGYRGEPHSLRRLRFAPADAAVLLVTAAYLAACRWLYPTYLL